VVVLRRPQSPQCRRASTTCCARPRLLRRPTGHARAGNRSCGRGHGRGDDSVSPSSDGGIEARGDRHRIPTRDRHAAAATQDPRRSDRRARSRSTRRLARAGASKDFRQADRLTGGQLRSVWGCCGDTTRTREDPGASRAQRNWLAENMPTYGAGRSCTGELRIGKRSSRRAAARLAAVLTGDGYDRRPRADIGIYRDMM